MKRCKVCNKLTDNGDKRCSKCGTSFEYDPKVSPFSETKIALLVLFLAAVGLIIARSLPLPLPDPTVCSRESYSRFKRIVARTHNDIMYILAENYIPSKNLSEIIVKKRAAEEMAVPACLEPAKADYVNYLNALYYTAVPSAWGAYDYATVYAESAAGYLDALQADLAKVRACLPDCE
jgi:hypothetical protein